MQRLSTRFPLVACFVFFSVRLIAQSDPYYTHYMLNRMAYNPAVAGEKNAICVNALTHQQWLGQEAQDPMYREGGGLPGQTEPGVNPATNTFGITAPLLKDNQLGLGFQVIQDKIGYQSTLQMELALAWKLRFGKKLANGEQDQTLAIGAHGGWYQGALDGSKYIPRQTGDPFIPTSLVSAGTMDFGFGLYYTQQSLEGFYAGLSMTHLNGGLVKYQWTGSGVNYQLKQHLYFLAGTRHKIGPSVALLPSVLVKSDLAKMQVDLSGRLEFNQKFVAGLNLRTGDATSVMLGYYVLKSLYVGYSYDVNIFSKVNRYTSAGTHELYISYCFDLDQGPPPPLKPRFNTRYLEGYTIR